MANHSPEAGLDTADTLRYDEINDTVSLVNTSDKAPGDECCAVYGRYPNGKLLYSYGFVIHNNPHRAIDLWTRVTPSISNAGHPLFHTVTHSSTLCYTHACTLLHSLIHTFTPSKCSLLHPLIHTVTPSSTPCHIY